jgi:hypothetical protein
VRMRNLNLGIVAALNLRERVDLAAGGSTLVAAAFLAAIGDVSWLLPFAIAGLYGLLVVRIWNRAAERRHSSALGNEGGSARQSKQGALSIAYWSFFMTLMGLAMAWGAVSQLTSRGGSVFSFVLLAAGVVLAGVGVLAVANTWRRSP